MLFLFIYRYDTAFSTDDSKTVQPVPQELVSCSNKLKFSFAGGVLIQLNKQVKYTAWIFLMHNIVGIGSAPRISDSQ